MNVKERIKLFIKHMNIGQNSFESKIGWSNGYINNTKNISADKLTPVINEYPLLNTEWLLTGRGDMLKKEHTRESEDYKEKYYKLLEEKDKIHTQLTEALQKLLSLSESTSLSKNASAPEELDVSDATKISAI